MRAAFQAFREAITPALKVSQFAEGKLTPDEFVYSCHALIRAYPSFQWLEVNPQYAKSILPPTNQCIICRNIPSRSRVSNQSESVEAQDTDGTGDDAWVATQIKHEPVTTVDEYADIDNYVDQSVLQTVNQDAGVAKPAEELRFYDMCITYDNYYACPRAYLVGRAANGTPLTPDEMSQDVMQDYVNRTATMERHPFSPDTITISIHPCRHAHAMKRILQGMSVGSGGNVSVGSYMVAFLKMLASMLPTMEYDYTGSVRL
jgi:ubiquitin-like-conjugating enzyme ATG3